MISDGAAVEQNEVLLSSQSHNDLGDSPSPCLLSTNPTNNNANTDTNTNSKSTTSQIILPKLRSCNVCKAHFRILHHFYDQLCPSCATLNYEKLHATADLTQNYIAIVTDFKPH